MSIQKPLAPTETSWIIADKISSLSSRREFQIAASQAREHSRVGGSRWHGSRMQLDQTAQPSELIGWPPRIPDIYR